MDGYTTILGQVPSKSNSYRIITINGRGSLAKTSAMKKYEDAFYMQIGSLRNKMIDDYFEFYIRAYYTNNRSDIDGCLKAVMDCLQRTKTIKNDNKCVKIVAEKFIDKDNPRIEFKIVEV